MSPQSRIRVPGCERMDCHLRTSPTRERGLREDRIVSPGLRVGLVWAIVFVWPCIVQAADPKPLSDGFRQVEQMSDLERGRLQRNLAEFKQLTPERQAHYRDLHLKLEVKKSEGSSLSSLLQEYSAWLTTLTPSQRDDLNKEIDPAKKLALVRQFKDAQEHRSEASTEETHEAPVVNGPMLHKQMSRFGSPLKGTELAAVMNTISRDLYGEDRKKPEGEPPLKYYRELLRSSIEKSLEGPHNWPSADLQQKLEQVPGVKEHFKKRQGQEGGRVALIRLIVGSLMKLAIEEFKPPNEQDRLDVFNKLSPEAQAEINKLRPDEIRWRLERQFYKQRGDNAPRQMHDFQQFIFQLVADLGLPPIQHPPFGGEGSRNGAGPGGPRRPSEGRHSFPEGGRPEEPPRGRNDPERPKGRPND